MIGKRNLQFSGSISIKSGQRQEYSDQELSGAISKSFIVKVAPVFTFLFIYLFIYLFYFILFSELRSQQNSSQSFFRVELFYLILR